MTCQMSGQVMFMQLNECLHDFFTTSALSYIYVTETVKAYLKFDTIPCESHTNLYLGHNW